MEPNKLFMRTIKYKDVIYLRKEDVISLILEFGGAEETDVRNRCKDLANNLRNMKGE
jgi:hypothetical protein